MNEPSLSLLARLQKFGSDRGKLAALRHYWSPATRHHAYPVLGQLNALSENPYHSEDAVIAALYALHAQSFSGSPHREGISLGKAAADLGERKDGEHPYDRHFHRLLASEALGSIEAPADLAQQLQRLIKRLNREGRGIDYQQLRKDLLDWNRFRQSDRVKLRWASDFWRSPLPETPTPSDA